MAKHVTESSYYRHIRKLPKSMAAGLWKLALVQKASSIVLWYGDDYPTHNDIQIFSEIAQELDALEQNSNSLRGSFSKNVQRLSGKGVSVVSEYSLLFGAAALGTVLGGPLGSLSASAAATFPHAMGASLLKELDHAGCDVKDAEALKVTFQDKEFMRHVRRASVIHGTQMSAAVLAAGKVAGLVHAAFAKPAASLGSSFARSVLGGLGNVAERSAAAIGELCATGVKTVSNTAGKKAIESLPVRALFLSTAARSVSSEEEIDDTPHQDLTRGAPKMPDHVFNRMYL